MQVKQNKSTRIQLSHCQGFIFILLTAGELVLLSLCIQCFTEFLKIRTCFKTVGLTGSYVKGVQIDKHSLTSNLKSRFLYTDFCCIA